MNIRCLMLGCLLAMPAAPSSPQDQAELSRLIAEHHAKQDIVKPPRGLLKHEYLVPAGPYFQLFDWDTYFMGVALSYDGIGRPLASSVEDFLEFVDEYANWPGYTPREIAPDRFWALPEMCKPFLAQAALRASMTRKSAAWLKEKSGASGETYYVKLAHTLSFWENTRRSPDGLFRWYNGVESGVDNNPAVADRPAETTEGVDLQCYLDREYRAMAVLADKLGYQDDAAEYRGRAAELERLVRQRMWSRPDGMFLNLNARTGEFIRVKTWTNLVPLWAGIATPEQADRMIRRHLLNPREFWSEHGVRTLAPSEPLYNPASGYWRGPIWVISNYLLMHGLMNYGYRQPARELAQRTVALLVDDYRRTGGMNECYDPDTGAPTAGGHFLSWNLLAEHMVEEAERNSDPTACRGF